MKPSEVIMAVVVSMLFTAFIVALAQNSYIKSLEARTLTVEDVVETIRFNDYILLEVYPNWRIPNEQRLGQSYEAVLYYAGPIADNPTQDTIIELYFFNSRDSIGASDITEVWYQTN